MICQLRTDKEINEVFERNSDTVYRVCLVHMKRHSQDLMDAFQQTFLKLMLYNKPFENAEHEKAWLIVTASNVCKDMLKSAWKRKVTVDSDHFEDYTLPFEIDETMECVFELPDKYKTTIYLYYYEGYSASEIGKLTGKSESSVWGYLHKGRKLLKDIIKESEHER